MDRFEDAKLRIKERVDLVELIEGYVPLRRRGRYLVGLCPFHQEKTPSFTVYPETQHFKCYGCGKAGDAFTFLMEREGVGFRDAMEQLGERAGVPLDGAFGRGGGESKRTAADAFGVLAAAAAFFAERLAAPEGGAALRYLEERGLAAARVPFQLGFHPAAPGAFARFVRERGLRVDLLVQAGLLGRDGQREPLRGRLVFPIVDERGRVVGFGGRVVPGSSDEGPKYLNSPESPFFNKRRLLFGMRQAKASGVRRIVVVEGYTDVIACHLAGQVGAVATLGTALTVDHARALERYATDGVVLLFDGDRAGRQAADRAFRELVHTSLPVRIALLPEGVDPADLARSGGRAALDPLIDAAEDALSMWFRLLRQRTDLSIDANVQRVAAECARILGEVDDPARREALRRNMARQLGVDETALRPVKRAAHAARAATSPAVAVRPGPPDPLRETELDLVAALCVEPALLDHREVDDLLLERCAESRVEEVVGWLQDLRASGCTGLAQVPPVLFARAGEDAGLHAFLAEAIDRAQRLRDPRSMFSMLLNARRAYFDRQQTRELRQQIAQALADGDHPLADRLTEHYMARLRRAGNSSSTAS
jgi:DNA primase